MATKRRYFQGKIDKYRDGLKREADFFWKPGQLLSTKNNISYWPTPKKQTDSFAVPAGIRLVKADCLFDCKPEFKAVLTKNQ